MFDDNDDCRLVYCPDVNINIWRSGGSWSERYAEDYSCLDDPNLVPVEVMFVTNDIEKAISVLGLKDMS